MQPCGTVSRRLPQRSTHAVLRLPEVAPGGRAWGGGVATRTRGSQATWHKAGSHRARSVTVCGGCGGLQVASGLRPAEITWDPGTRWVAEEGRWREARPPRPWGDQAEVFSPRNSEDVGHEQPVRGQVWDWGVGGGPGALPAPPLPRSRGASQQHGRASTTTGAPLVEILPGDPGQVGQPGDREVGSRVALGPIPPRLSLPPLVTSCLRSHPTPPASPPPSPKWTGLSSSPERPWVKPGEGVRPSSVGEALGPQGLLGPVSPGPLSAQTVPWSSL